MVSSVQYRDQARGADDSPRRERQEAPSRDVDNARVQQGRQMEQDSPSRGGAVGSSSAEEVGSNSAPEEAVSVNAKPPSKCPAQRVASTAVSHTAHTKTTKQSPGAKSVPPHGTNEKTKQSLVTKYTTYTIPTTKQNKATVPQNKTNKRSTQPPESPRARKVPRGRPSRKRKPGPGPEPVPPTSAARWRANRRAHKS